MPYQSRKQAAYMHIHEPEIAADWDEKYYGKKKRGGRVSKSQQRYGGAGTHGRRQTDDDSAIVKRDDWMNISEHERRSRDSRRTRNRGSVVATAGGFGGALTLEHNRSARQLVPGTKTTGAQMKDLGHNLKTAAKERNRVPLKTSLPYIARHSPHGVAGAASAATIGTGGAMMVGGRMAEKYHDKAVARQRRARAVVATRPDDASKAYPSKEEPKTKAHRIHNISGGIGVGGAVGSLVGTAIGGREGQIENLAAHDIARQHMNFENETARMKGYKGRWTPKQKMLGHGILAGHNMRKRPVAALTTAADLATFGSIPVTLTAGAKYDKQEKARKAKARAERKAAKLAAAPTEVASKAARYYDDEQRRQNRLGMYQGALIVTGGGAAGEGGRRIYLDTKKLRAMTVREPAKGGRPGLRVPLGETAHGKGAVSLKKVPVALAAGGATALAGAGAIHRHGKSNRGAAYR